MRFERLKIENFLSYYKPITIDFSPVSTILLGQNNTGKSKLFDSISWVLYNRIFLTEREEWIQGNNKCSEYVLNRYAESEALSADDDSRIQCSVALNIVFEDESVMITREYSYAKSDSKLVFVDSDLTYQIYDEFGSVMKTLAGGNAQDAISGYLPAHLSKYFLFQGETVSEIMSLHKKAHFTDAIRELARLDVFENATRASSTVKDRYKTKRDKILIRDQQTQKQAEQISRNLKNEHEAYKTVLDKIDDVDKEIDQYQREIESLRTWLAEHESIKELLDKQDELIAEIKANRKLLGSLESFEWKSELTEKWLFYRVKEKFDEFPELYRTLEKKGEVPAPVTQSEIKRILEKQLCTTCERPLEKGTTDYRKMEERLNDFNIELDLFSTQLNSILHEVHAFENFRDYIPEEIDQEIVKREQLDQSIRVRRKELVELERDLSSLKNKNLPENLKDEINKKLHDLRRRREYKQEAEREMAKHEGKRDELELRIRRYNAELSNLTRDIDVEDEEAMFQIAGSVHDRMQGLEKKIKSSVIGEIEKAANDYFQEMTKENPSYGGQIKLDQDNQEVYTVDVDGSRIENINQANRVSIQLSFIAGILTVAEQQMGVVFPFIADAPISALGGDNKLPAIRSLVNAFEQSIIILKDDLSSNATGQRDPVREYIQQSEQIEKAYLLRLSKSESSLEQYTVISEIKG